MPFPREDIRESVERAGDAHWKALRDHPEDAYPASRPTPGDVCKAEAERLNEMGLGDAKEFELELLRVAKAHLVEPLRLRLAHVARRGPARGIGVLGVIPQCLPVRIAGALYRLADVFAGERHGVSDPGSAPHFSATGFTSSGAPATSVGASAPRAALLNAATSVRSSSLKRAR